MNKTVAFVSLLLFFVTAVAQNKQAPDFRLPVYGTKDSISLKELRGKYVLLDFWYAGCPPCKHTLPALIKLANRNKSSLVILGLNPYDDDDRIKEFLATSGVNYAIVKTPRMFPAETYKVSVFPTLYLVNPQGELVYTHEGYPLNDSYQQEFIKDIEKRIKK